jgi:alkylation response protein AidB-like acyl-CoA dehydrogenase
MDFALSDPMKHLLGRIEEFLRREVFPRERELLTPGRLNGDEPAIRSLRNQVKQLGMWAPQLPKELGGMGLTLLEHGLVSEALGRSPLGHFVFGCQAPDAGNIEILHKYGTKEQQARWLVPLVAGEIRSCFSMTEPDTPGSNPTQLACTARKDGADYVIDGHKWFTSSADGAAFAIVMAVTNPEAPPHLRASQIIVPTDTRGFNRVRNISMFGHSGGGWMSHAEVRYEGVRVPQTNRLGSEGAGFLIAQERLGPGRIHHCMRWIGICQRSFDLMCTRAVTRKMDGEKTLATKQFVQGWVAESRAEIDAARLAVLHAAWTIDQSGFQAAAEEISLIKFHVAGVLSRVVDRAVQVHGALGITDDTVLAGYYAHERGARIYDGPDEVHKISVAKKILARYAR